MIAEPVRILDFARVHLVADHHHLFEDEVNSQGLGHMLNMYEEGACAADMEM